MGVQLVVQEPFATVLQRCRLAAGLSQGELAERAGLSERGISDLERGVRRHPHPSTTRQLAEGLGLDKSDRAKLLDARAQPLHARSQRRAERFSPVAESPVSPPARLPVGEAALVDLAASLLLECVDAYLSVTSDRRRLAEQVIGLAARHLARDASQQQTEWSEPSTRSIPVENQPATPGADHSGF